MRRRRHQLVLQCHASTDVVHVCSVHVCLVHADDLASNGGLRGDVFMRNMEQVAASLPYLVAVGNHESFQNYAHYTERFRHMPANSTGKVLTGNGEAMNNWWYSFDDGLVHFVAVSTELYFHPERLVDGVRRQFAWLEADLARANARRDRIPWIVVYGHRPLYSASCPRGDCSPSAGGPLVDGGCAFCCVDPGKCAAGCCPGNSTKVPGLEQLFFKHGVDLYVGGHIHDYERMYDIHLGRSERRTTNMSATTYITTGAGGSDEGTGGAPLLPSRATAFRSNALSFSVMEVANRTHMHWQQLHTDPTRMNDYGRVLDDVWLVQHNHGSFASQHAATATKLFDAGVAAIRRTDSKMVISEEKDRGHEDHDLVCFVRHTVVDGVVEDTCMSLSLARPI
eukprot:SAG31_NODE_1919_length_6920_cov_5.391731_2_plen_395_part_00